MLNLGDITKVFAHTLTPEERTKLPESLQTLYKPLSEASEQQTTTSSDFLRLIKSFFGPLEATTTYRQNGGKDFARVTEPISKKAPIDFTNIIKIFRELIETESKEKEVKGKTKDEQLIAMSRIYFYLAYILKKVEKAKIDDFKISLYDAVILGVNSYIVMHKFESKLKLLSFKMDKGSRKKFFKELEAKKDDPVELYKCIHNFVLEGVKSTNHYLITFLYNFCKVAQPAMILAGHFEVEKLQLQELKKEHRVKLKDVVTSPHSPTFYQPAAAKPAPLGVLITDDLSYRVKSETLGQSGLPPSDNSSTSTPPKPM